MLAACSKWILLLTFAAHAVLGCCIHHHHAAFDAAQLLSQFRSTSTTEVPAEVVGAAESNGHHCTCHHHQRRTFVPVDAPAAPTVPDEDHSQCDEHNCCYVAVNPSAHELDGTTHTLSIDEVLSLTHLEQLVSMAKSSISHLDRHQPRCSLNRCCALEHSWQL